MAAYVELYADQGSTFNNLITLSDDTTNTAINLVGHSVASQMRRSFYSSNASAIINCTILDPSDGILEMNLSAGTTANLKAGHYLFDIETTSPTGEVSRILEGSITISPGVTR
jgi:hypothetical protein